MSTRKYAFGNENFKKRKKEEKLIESQKWSMDKFVISNKQNITQNLDEKEMLYYQLKGDVRRTWMQKFN